MILKYLVNVLLIIKIFDNFDLRGDIVDKLKESKAEIVWSRKKEDTRLRHKFGSVARPPRSET